jgi:hypothetical protein
MTVIIDTRVVRLLRTAARTGHQHSGDQNIVESVVREIVTASDIISLPPGSLITLQRGPGAGLVEEGSILNAVHLEIGGAQSGQTTSVLFNSEDGDVTSGLVFQRELDFTAVLTLAGDYAINYKTFQIKTYTAVPTTIGQRILITYTWAPIREYLKWSPESLIPELEAFGNGPHAKNGGTNIIEGCGIIITNTEDGYKEISIDIPNLAGPGLTYEIGPNGCARLVADAITNGNNIAEGCGINISTTEDGYKEISIDVPSLAGTGLTYEIGPDGCDRLAVDFLDGYTSIIHIRKSGLDTENSPFNSIFRLDGYEYPTGQDRLILWINGVAQFAPMDFTERSTTTIETAEPCDVDDVLDIYILPQAFGSAISNAGTTDLQGAYDNSPIGAKDIELDSGQITFTQTQASGSALRLISTGSVTPTLVVDQGGGGEAARFKTLDNIASAILIQKDVSNRNSIQNTVIIERSTSHVLGGLIGIGSSILTRLENTGTGLFTASRLITAAEDATDATENTYFAIELIDDGSVGEKLRLTSTGRLGINTNNPSATLHVQGDGYFSQGVEIAHQVKIHNTPNAPLNVPILNEDPPTINDGDVWITDISGIRKINAMIGGITYSVQLTI